MKQKRFWAGVLLVQFFLFYFLSKSETAINFFYRLFELKKYLHQILFSKIPFSIGDQIYILMVFFLVILIFKLFKKEKRQKGAIFLLLFLNVFYFIYQIFWGMLYFQKPLTVQLSNKDITQQSAKLLCLKYLKLCIEDRELVAGNKQGVFEIADIKKVQSAILIAQSSLPKRFTNKNVHFINDFKPSVFKSAMSFTGILGYYNPFTAEAQYNSDLPATFLPFTIAHESAHQLGFARENEANFIGYLIGKNSPNKALKYSTDLFVLKSLLAYINISDNGFRKKIIMNFSQKMESDRQNDLTFIKNHQSFLIAIFDITNNLFLKSNQQEGNITYSYFTEMLIEYELQQH
ncbi:DUF3810 domain-containing protein [Halpernia sp. GG3]